MISVKADGLVGGVWVVPGFALYECHKNMLLSAADEIMTAGGVDVVLEPAA